MATVVVCDICKDDEHLRATTGRYVVTVTKYLKEEKGVSTTQDTEYDVCGACMQKLRQAGLK